MEFSCVTQAALEITMLKSDLEDMKSQKYARLSLQSDVFKGVCHYTQLHEIL